MTDGERAGALSERWLEALVGAGGAPGPSLTVQVVVNGGPEGEAHASCRIVDGVVSESEPSETGPVDVTVTASTEDAAAMAAGELDPSVAFMQGRMKTAGDPGLLLDLLAHRGTGVAP